MSNLFKASSYSTNGERKVIEIAEKVIKPASSHRPAKQLPDGGQDYAAEEAQLAMLTQAEQQVAQIIAEANRKAEQIVLENKEQCAALKRQTEAEIAAWWEEQREEVKKLRNQAVEEGRHEGYQAGHQEGMESSLAAYRELIDKANKLLEKAHEEKKEIIASAEPFLIELSVAISRKILAAELALDNEKVMGMVREALARVRNRGTVTISVDPAFYQVLLEKREMLLKMLDSQSDLLILPDHRLEDGGCLIETGMGSVDARIDTQLGEIKHALLQVTRGSESNEQTVGGKIPASIE